MTIELYVSTSEKERLNKTSYLSLIGSFDGTLRQDSSIINPTILMQLAIEAQSTIIDEDDEELEDADGNDVSIDTNRVTQANYMFIPEFGRYYFINDIVVGKTGIYTIRASVDVLMTYKDAIGDIYCFVDRNEFEYSAMEQDDFLPLKYVKEVTESKVLDYGNLVNTKFDADVSLFSNKHNIVITTNTNLKRVGTQVIDPPTNSELPKISSIAFSSYGMSMPFVITPQMLGYIGDALQDQNYSTYSDFIKSIVAFPFVITQYIFDTWIPFGEGGRTITINGHDVKGTDIQSLSDYLIVADFMMQQPSSYLDFSPYTRYELYIPFFGWFELDYQSVYGHRLIVYYSVNYEDGSGTAYVYDMTDKKPVFSTATQLGVRLSTTKTNKQELETQKTAENLNLAVGLISSAVSIAGGIAHTNPVATAMGAVAGARAITNYINANAMMFENARSSFGGSSASLYTILEVRLRMTRTKVIPSDLSGYAHARGRPLRKMKQLSSLSGFTIAQNPHLDNVPCLGTEADEIARLLSTGVIL